MWGTGYTNSAYSFTNVQAFAGAGSTDSALLIDSAGSNSFDGSNNIGYLLSVSNGITVQWFTSVTLLDQNGNNDHEFISNPVDYALQAVGNWAGRRGIGS